MKKIKNILKMHITKREITLILIFMMVILLFLSGYSIGKTVYKTTIAANAQIAEPVIVVENNPAIDINNENSNGIYTFKVKDFDGDKITQSDLKYYIEIISKEAKNIDFKLYQDDEEIQLINNKTNDMFFSKDTKAEHNYRLEIHCKNQDNIGNIIDNIQIKVHSEQTKI